MKFVTAIVLLMAGVMSAQQTRTETTTTWNGTLIDAGCYTTQTQRVTRDANGGATRTTTEQVQCPVTGNTKAFGLITADGQVIRFDDPSNTKVVQIVKNTQTLTSPATRVRVVGTSHGDVAVIETLTPEASVQSIGEADRVAPSAGNLNFDVKYDDDRGRLIVNDKGVTFEDISNAKHSRTWTYAQIKEFERESNNKVRIKAYTGDSFDFKLESQAMSDAAYKVIADRVVAARSK